MKRRDFLGATAANGMILALPPALTGKGPAPPAQPAPGALSPKTPDRIQVLLFTKHLQFLRKYEEVAETAAEIGFDGLDIAVRDGGHVDPKEAKANLPRFVEAARARNLSVPMITTRVQNATDPTHRMVLQAAAEQGVPFYRIGEWSYRDDLSIPDRLNQLRAQLIELAQFNASLGLCAVYQNHSGAGRVGAPLWDLWTMMRDVDPRALAVNFDIGHATVEGGLSWPTQYRLLADRVRVVTVKDFEWDKDDGDYRVEWVPLGEGMIRVGDFMKMLKLDHFVGPITMHFEYDVGDDRRKVASRMKKDLDRLRAAMREAGLA